jgi:hypothetical protein
MSVLIPEFASSEGAQSAQTLFLPEMQLRLALFIVLCCTRPHEINKGWDEVRILELGVAFVVVTPGNLMYTA